MKIPVLIVMGHLVMFRLVQFDHVLLHKLLLRYVIGVGKFYTVLSLQKMC